jgi:hypothetical protein
MRNDPGMRETGIGSDWRAGPPRVESDDGDIHNVIERAVVGACFKSAKRTPQSKAANSACEYQPAETAPARSSGDFGMPRKRLPAINGAGCGTAAMAGMKRFLAIMDKVYDKLLSDGDFDFIGFMAARGLDAGETLDLLEACAARLGADWSCDARGFVKVTIAMSRLQRILTAFGQENRNFDANAYERSVLFVVPHGEVHLFAVSLMEERFRLKGWETTLVFANRSADLARLLKNGHFELICLTWLDSELKNQVESLLLAIRASVDRERTYVIAGGSATEEHSGWLIEQGVEKICSNAHIALETAERLGANRNSAHGVTETNGSQVEPTRRA